MKIVLANVGLVPLTTDTHEVGAELKKKIEGGGT